jgi:hypothetical protein
MPAQVAAAEEREDVTCHMRGLDEGDRPMATSGKVNPPPNRRAQLRPGVGQIGSPWHARGTASRWPATSPNRCCSVQSPPRSNGDHGPVLRRAPRCRARRRFETTGHRAGTSSSRCANIWIETSSAAQGSQEAGANRKYSGTSAGGHDLPPPGLQGGGVHQAQGDRDSTMSGSVEATTAIALMMMSSGTPASRMAATRCPATAARSSWLIPRPAWAWSSGRPS